MIKLDPTVYAYLKQLLPLLFSFPVQEIRDELSALNRVLSEADWTGAVREEDAKVFSDKLQRILQTIERGQNPFFRTQYRAASSAQRDEPPFAERVHHALSRSKTLKNFSSSRADSFIELALLLPQIRKETSLENLSLRDVVNFCVSNGKIPAPDENFFLQIESQDSFDPAVFASKFPEIDTAELSTPDRLITFLINKAPHLLREGRLAQIAYQLATRRTMSDHVNYYLTIRAYDFALEGLKKYNLTGTKSADLANIIVGARDRAEQHFPGTSISPFNLLYILRATGQITGSFENHMSAVDLFEIYQNSRILRSLGALVESGSISQATLLPQLMNLLPLIQDELDDYGLTLREVILATFKKGFFKESEGSLLRTAAYYDLYNHSAMKDITEEDLSSPQKLVDRLVTLRTDIGGYSRAHISHFIQAMTLIGTIDRQDPGIDSYFGLAAAYDTAFDLLDDIHDIEEQTSAEILITISKIVEQVKGIYPDAEISFYTMATDLASSGRVTRNIPPLSIQAVAADLARAWKSSGGLPEVSAEPEAPISQGAPQVVAGGERALHTPFLDQFSKEVRPYVEMAAARDFVALFERELEEEDLKTPQALISKIESIRYTLEGYEHAPLTTFVKALEIMRRLPGKAMDYLRLAGAYDLWEHHLNRIGEEDLATPEKLAEKIAAIRTEIEGRENERLVTFVEALAVIGKLPGKLKPYTDAAAIYDSMLPPHADGEEGSTPPVSGGGGGGHGRGPLAHRLPNAASLPVEGVRHFMIPGMVSTLTGAPVPPLYMGAPGLMPMMPSIGIPVI